ncbi:MAG: hypothetical protein H7196_04825 [candidate division SR1 bacterium]|nr:hypothetical protein [candidate division SR1 bacterium]
MSLVSIKSGKSELTVELNSGQVVQWSHDGVGVFYQGSNIRRSGIPILFPFANSLKDNIFNISGKKIRQHGFGRDFPWQIGKQTESSIELILITQDISLEMQKIYPFHFKVKIKLELLDNRLTYTLQISNHGENPMPIAPGIHPYFPIKHTQKSKMTVNNLRGYDSNKINWNEKNDGIFYNFDKFVKVCFPDSRSLQLEQGDQKDFNYLVFWSQLQDNVDHDFICIEPFTRKTNAINDDPILLKPMETWSNSIAFILS